MSNLVEAFNKGLLTEHELKRLLKQLQQIKQKRLVYQKYLKQFCPKCGNRVKGEGLCEKCV